MYIIWKKQYKQAPVRIQIETSNQLIKVPRACFHPSRLYAIYKHIIIIIKKKIRCKKRRRIVSKRQNTTDTKLLSTTISVNYLQPQVHVCHIYKKTVKNS